MQLQEIVENVSALNFALLATSIMYISNTVYLEFRSKDRSKFRELYGKERDRVIAEVEETLKNSKRIN